MNYEECESYIILVCKGGGGGWVYIALSYTLIFYSSTGATTVSNFIFIFIHQDYTMLKSPPEEQIKQAAKRRRDNSGVSIPSPEVIDVAYTLK